MEGSVMDKRTATNENPSWSIWDWINGSGWGGSGK